MALVDQIIGVESGGNSSARNPRSSATGAGQFIDATWLDMMARHRPDLTTGRSREEVLSLRSDPDLSREMTQAYAAENAQKLQGAGLPVTAGTSYLAHFAGPKGAVSILNADPSAPVSQILGGKVVKANPFLANMTAGDLRAWADKKMGVQAMPAPAQRAMPQPQVQQPAPAPMQASPVTPIFAPSRQATAQDSPALVPEQAAAPPLVFAQRRPIDLSKLRAALEASGNRGRII